MTAILHTPITPRSEPWAVASFVLVYGVPGFLYYSHVNEHWTVRLGSWEIRTTGFYVPLNQYITRRAAPSTLDVVATHIEQMLQAERGA